MWNDVICTVLIGCVVFLLVAVQKRRGRNYPPGPTPWPVIGNLPQLRGNIVDSFDCIRKQYGDVYSLYLGSMFTVVVNGLDGIREVLITKSDEFIDRPLLFVSEVISKGKGIGNTNGEVWKEQRRFTLHTLRDFGFGRVSLEGKVMEEVEVLMERLEETRGYLPGDMFQYKRLVRNSKLTEDFLKERIEDHKRSFDPNNLRDFIDGYLAEMAQQGGKESSFEDGQLLKVVNDLFLAGSETTATTLMWALLYLMHNPAVQTKIKEEIHSVVGTSRLPSMADRKHMPYVEASLMEIQRCADIAFLGIPRMSTVKTTLNGYTIPKGAIIMPVLTTLHKDPNVWEDPEVFNPQRFLKPDGTVAKREHFLPFSAGKRNCIGESLAKMELFLFLTTMLQRFVFKLPEGVTSLPLEPRLGLTREPVAFKLRAVVDV